MSRVLVLLLSVTMLGVGCDGDVGVETTSEKRVPNILWLTIDTIRADHLGAYGYFRETSPHFDALTEESILFDRCLAPMATTLPSHVTALTATYPHEHGVLANVRMGGGG